MEERLIIDERMAKWDLGNLRREEETMTEPLTEEERGKRAEYFLSFQQSEIDGAALYRNIARDLKDEKDRKILLDIADDEIGHAHVFQHYTGVEAKPNILKVGFYTFLSKIFGYTFAVKYFERDEAFMTERYGSSPWQTPEMQQIMADEERHESTLIGLLDEERVRYTGSIVLGMNDALVELTGALAGYSFAMQNTKLIAMAGLITGCSATLSMAVSGYLSSHAEGRSDALRCAVYTGIAYLFTVAALIFPFLCFGKENYIPALFVTLTTAIGIIAVFNGYMSVVLDRPFKQEFFKMSALSLGVAVISFFIGIVVKNVLGIDI